MTHNNRHPNRPNPFQSFSSQEPALIRPHQQGTPVPQPLTQGQNTQHGNRPPTANSPTQVQVATYLNLRPQFYHRPQMAAQPTPRPQQPHPQAQMTTPFQNHQIRPRQRAAIAMTQRSSSIQLPDQATITHHRALASRQLNYSSLSPEQKAEQDEWAWWVIDLLACCPCGYKWRREDSQLLHGYRCLGGFHFIEDKNLSEGRFLPRMRPKRERMVEGAWEVLKALYDWDESGRPKGDGGRPRRRLCEGRRYGDFA